MKTIRRDAIRVYDDLVNYALAMTCCVHGDRVRLFRRQMERARFTGEEVEIPEEMKPGYLLRHLNADDREALKELTSFEVARRALRCDVLQLYY